MAAAESVSNIVSSLATSGRAAPSGKTLAVCTLIHNLFTQPTPLAGMPARSPLPFYIVVPLVSSF